MSLVEGDVASGFEPVRSAAEAIVATHGGGVSVAAIVDGQVVCDLWGGGLGSRSLVHTWSVVKPVTAACLLVAAAGHGLALDRPVRDVWPSLAAAADGRLTIGGLLAHRGGLSTVPGGDVTRLLDPGASEAALEVAAPDWPPGTAAGEHALTFGHLVSGVLRRIDGRTVGPFLAQEIATPLGLDIHVGLDAGQQSRVVALAGADAAWWRGLSAGRSALFAAALGTGMSSQVVNGASWRAGEVAAVNGHATALGMARFWWAVLAAELPAAVLTPYDGATEDRVLGSTVAWTTGSAQHDVDEVGMGGVGGSYAGVRPDQRLAWSFLTTLMGTHDRAVMVEDALVACCRG